MTASRDKPTVLVRQEQPTARQDHQDYKEILDHLESLDHEEWTEGPALTVSASLPALAVEEDVSNAYLVHQDLQV